MNIFLTGATGFIGSYLTKELLSQGHCLMCLKRHSSNLFRLNNFADNIVWVNVEDNWKQSFAGFKPYVVFNLAWDGVSSSDRLIWAKQVNNIAFQQDLLDLANRYGVKKFVGIGSQSEYGDFEGVVDESFPVNPRTAYAASKVACLDLLKCFCEIHDIEWYWFRLFPLFGPYESDKWLIPSLIKTISTQKSMDLTSGEQILPYLYVGECAKAIASPLYAKEKSGIYNVCADNAQPLKKLVTKIRDRVDPTFRLNFGALSYRFGQSMYMCGKTDRLFSELYSLDTSSFEKRLGETIDYFVELYGKDQK